MIIRNNVPAKPLNTFGLDHNISTLVTIEHSEDLQYLNGVKDFRILGGGSNILMTEDVAIPVVQMANKGIEIIKEGESYVLVKFEAGEVWHDAVIWSLENNFGGIENLSLIPGRCGAAPMQNIGAYGVEIKDVLHSVYAYDIALGVLKCFHNSECGFAYRTSHFKTDWKNRYIITSIVLKLSKEGHHEINTEYGAIRSELNNAGVNHATIHDVSDAVIAIRKSKLPDPAFIGNAGSFFKNPVIDNNQYKTLIQRYPDIVAYELEGGYKLAAGWLIDQCGWKGFRSDHGTGTHKNQALVLVNYGNAEGHKIFELAREIMESVYDRYGVVLEPEVNIWN